ncbi:heavy metal-binding domain-containing protein [Eudoraea sp.]|uniref:heavy metal-binding domain-containing protein n=1 Tax=Eudoraea sp. TaxID=1979955 RepID=UPI003C782A99
MKLKIHEYLNQFNRMSKIIKLFLSGILAIASITMVSCKDNKTKTETETTTEQQGKEYTSAYVCPMHCKDSGSDQEGTCDTCGMTLVKNEDHGTNSHAHE